jgi:RHS repeat-associated protein
LKTSYIYADGQILSQRIHTDPEDPNIFTPYYYVHDRLGSVRLMIDDTGTAVNSYCYKPYGSFYESEVVEAVANPWAFTGQYYDAEIAQYYLRARQYDPQMMRFTSRDPITGKRNYPMTLHKYLYCINTPVNLIDPKGEMYQILEPIMAAHSVHTFAIAVAATGVALGNWNIITYGIALERSILPVMALTMAMAKGKDARDIINGYNSDVRSNFDPSGAPNLPPGVGKWIALGTAMALLTQVEGCIEGVDEFWKWLAGHEDIPAEPEIRPAPTP